MHYQPLDIPINKNKVTGSHKKQLRLGELLVQQGVASVDQIEIALLRKKSAGSWLSLVLRQRPLFVMLLEV
jgi:hypothetical protein